MENTLHMSFASSLTDLCELNSSFDSGVLRICYTGKNRNQSFFSKEDIERNLKTIYNCPIVVNYDIESGSFGGHDMKVVHDSNGDVRIINTTEPVGVIPESSRVWFDWADDENGVSHEYLYADVLLWKRQAAYEKIKRDGVVKHSMEVSVKNGEIIDGVYHIHDFEFTAFALLGDDVEPCFESSALEVFSASKFKRSMSEMMQDLKDTYHSIDAHDRAEDKTKNDTEGGEEVLDEKIELAKKYGVDIDTLDFDLNTLSIEELTQKFEDMRQELPAVPAGEGNYALTGNIVDEILRVLSEQKIMREWGECERYCYIDCDFEAHEVYCWDREDWLMYGFKYEMNGDAITIDFSQKQRKKYVIADFEDGDSQASPFESEYALIMDAYKKIVESRDTYESMFNEKDRSYTQLESEVIDLRKYKSDIESAQEQAARDSIFKKFEKLNGIEAFENLKANCEGLTIEQIEEKCFAIKGRMDVSIDQDAKFSMTPAAPRIPVDKVTHAGDEAEPYDGLFTKYGF